MKAELTVTFDTDTGKCEVHANTHARILLLGMIEMAKPLLGNLTRDTNIKVVNKDLAGLKLA